jgi:hypothetical protein
MMPLLFAGGADGSGLIVTYRPGGEDITGAGDENTPVLAVVQRPGPASAVDLIRGSSQDSETKTVRDRPAVLGRSDDEVAVQWAEPGGHFVTVAGYRIAEDHVLRVAASLRPAGDGEVDALLGDHAAPEPGEFGDPPDGQVVVAEGETPTGRWRVVADTAAPDGLEGLTIERVSDSSSMSGTASGMAEGGSEEPPVELVTDTEEGVTIVYGLVHPDAAAVDYEAPGVEGTIEVHEIDGWDRKVIAVDLSAALPEDPAAEAIGTVTLIARDTEGRELGRHQVVVDPEPAWPEDGPSPEGVVEECTTLPDGSTECVEFETGDTPMRP